MSKVLVLEESVRKIPKTDGFHHVFSFFTNQADSFPENYLSSNEEESIYNQSFDEICSDLNSSALDKSFEYRGVPLVWCFKKRIFEYLFHARLRYHIFKRLAERFPLSDFYLSRGTQTGSSLSLAKIIIASSLRKSFRLHPTYSGPRLQEKETKRTAFQLMRSPFLALGRLIGKKVVIFSDFEKSKAVVLRAGGSSCVFFSTSFAPRDVFRAIGCKSAIYQSSFKFANRGNYNSLAQSFVKEFRRRELFSSSNTQEELRKGVLMSWRVEELFERSLPQLLFDIDQMHHFFMQARLVETALLDEDVSPAKSAFCHVARQYGVTSFVECHGSLGHQIGFLPMSADQIFVWGKPQKQKLVRWGCPAERIIVSGCSRYRQWELMDAQKLKHKVAREFKFDKGKQIILFGLPTTNPNRFIFEHKMKGIIEDAFAVLLDVVRARKNSLQVIVKTHPGDSNLEFYRKWVRKENLSDEVVVIDKHEPLILAKVADLVVVYHSTYAVDGFALRKPVICWGGSDILMLSEYKGFRTFHYADKKDELRSLIHRLLDHPEKDHGGTLPNARAECLNETGEDPAAFIASYLLKRDLKQDAETILREKHVLAPVN